MDYMRIYNQLILRAKARGIPMCYYEVHHIIPRCMGGNDDPENLVPLTSREHFVAHLLLYKVFGDVPGVVYSAYRMAAKNNRHYAALREKFVENQRKKKTQMIEYKGNYYCGFDDLKEKTGVSNYLYHKYYINGRDPEPFINNNTYGMVAKMKNTGGSKSALGTAWYNNGKEEKYSSVAIDGWIRGRLPKARDAVTGQWIKMNPQEEDCDACRI